MSPDDESQGPVVHDHRRIDPATGQVRNLSEARSQQGPTSSAGPPRPGRHSARPGGQGSAQGMPGGSGRGPAASPGSGTGEARPGGPGAGGPARNERAPAATADEQASQRLDGDENHGAQHETAREPAEAAVAEATAKLAERTADLQRLQAEYANYRKRVERDRQAVREQALANVLNELIPVLDDIGRAREHGELVGGFKSVGESLEAIAAKLGLTSFGEAGEPFDPVLHDALMHSYSPDVTEPTAVQILQPGYKVGERIIRPARVAVAEPGGDAADQETYAQADSTADGPEEAGRDGASHPGRGDGDAGAAGPPGDAAR